MPHATPPGWVRDAVFYQIFPDRFARDPRLPAPGPLEDWNAPPTTHGFKGGNLFGVAERMDYLVDLGITALYLNPIFASASNHRYHTYDYLAVDPLLGGNEALRTLLDTAHEHGIRVVLDGVFNHTGRGFWPFHHVVESGAASPYRDWFHFNADWLADARQIQPYPDAELGKPPPPEWWIEHAAGTESIAAIGYRAWWDLPALPKLNVSNPATREYILGVAEHWIRFGADGWRLDVAEEIADMGFWAEFRQRVRNANSDAYIVGEIWRVGPEWVGDGTFDGLMNYPLALTTLGFVAGTRLDRNVVNEQGFIAANLVTLDGEGFAAAIESQLRAYHPSHAAAHLNLLGSHDMPRIWHLSGEDETSVRLATMVQMTLPGAPCIYYGDEIGLGGHHDPDCRRTFPWERTRWNEPLRAFVRRAIAVRKATPALRADDFAILGTLGLACAYGRTDGHGAQALVAINAGDEAVVLTLPRMSVDPAPVLAVNDPTLEASGDELRIRLPARSGAAWSDRS